MKCARCDAEVDGRFCGSCGATLTARDCSLCLAPVPPGHRYCSECGAEQGAPAVGVPDGGAPAGQDEDSPASFEATHSSSLDHKGWWIIGAAVLAGILFLAIPYVWTGWTDGGNGERVPMGAVAPGTGQGMVPGGGTGVDLSSMTPREAADRLFNRVMTAMGDGDTAEVESFLPMALDAYAMVPDLDADGHFHVSLLQQAQGDFQSGMETAEAVLERNPDHLLLRYAAGEAARNLGDTDGALQHFSHLLEVFDEESGRNLPEYQEHASFLPIIQETAEDFLATGGS